MKYLRKNRSTPRQDVSTPPPSRVYRKQMPATPPVPYTGGEDETSHEQHLRYLAAECRKVKPNPTITLQLMRRTFALRQKEIKENHLSMQNKYPPLKSYKEVSLEMDSDLKLFVSRPPPACLHTVNPSLPPLYFFDVIHRSKLTVDSPHYIFTKCKNM